MKSMRWILLGLIFMTCLGTVDIGAAAERKVTNESVDQWYSALNGEWVLWSDNRTGDYNVYLYSATQDTETAITNATASQIVSTMSLRSMIEGDRFVWQDNRSGNWDIFMYDLASGQGMQITDDAADQINPAIAGDRLVWQDNRSGNWDIFMYDLASGQEMQVTTNESQQVTPGVTGSLIAWNDDRYGNWDIFIWVPDGAGGTDGTGSEGTAAPVADFTYQEEGSLLFQYAFTDASTGTIVAWYWDFGDGTTSTEQNPNHKYPYLYEGMTLQVTLTVKDANGRVASVTKPLTLPGVQPEPEPLKADFTWGPPADPMIPATFAFTDTSTGSPVQWLWDFGDSSTSTMQNPDHKYPYLYEGMTLQVTLTVWNAGGESDSVTKTVPVSC
jgi:beta propeller repeat protein